MRHVRLFAWNDGFKTYVVLKMTSSIDICSNALQLIGDEPINSFDEPGAGAKVAKALYQTIKETLLSSHTWSFALKQQRLSRLSQVPDKKTGYNYAFQLPTDLIRIWNIQDHSDYILINGLLYSNNKELLCTYIYDVEESALPPQFAKSLEYALAADFAISITENQSMNALYEQKAQMAAIMARSIDSQGRPQQGFIDRPLIDVR